MARLDAIKADVARLADPRRLSSDEPVALVEQLPVIVHLEHAVHGNEISSSDAALAEAYHLLAAQNDAEVQTILREALVLIDPAREPGRARAFRHVTRSSGARRRRTPIRCRPSTTSPGPAGARTTTCST